MLWYYYSNLEYATVYDITYFRERQRATEVPGSRATGGGARTPRRLLILFE